jgi:gas vesicle protein
MKKVSKLLTGIVAGLVLAALTTPAFAAEKGKEKTITGEAKCAKCALKEGTKCQTVIQTEGKDGKMVTYYLVNNDVAKAFHDNVCSATKKVKATGTVKKVDGKEEMEVTKIDIAK